MIEQLAIAALCGLVSGLVTGLLFVGGLRVELRYLRRDLDDHHARLKRLEGLRVVGQSQESHNVA